MLTEEKINLNYVGFVGKLQKFGCYTEKLEKDIDFNDKLKKASAFLKDDSGGAYAGSLVEHITRIALIAFKLNETLFKEAQVPVESLIKTCYLFQISKALMIEENTIEYEVKKGKLFKFVDNLNAIKTGEYSIYLCAKYGIDLTIDEHEAILSIDKEDNNQTKFFSNILSTIIKSSNDLANSERKIRYKNFVESNKK